ncbi:MAG TPA: putative molybdenum carrier protein, partial [Desulfosalsimonadaceae bacterium]|nr:putative molybdenum carrier protein [Desulfosalsimonadaceae bacterium]
LDFAMEYGITCGGWVPAGREAEDGIIPERYSVWEMESGGYVERTEKNVMEADGTLIASHGELSGGSLLTLEFAQKHHRPCLHIDFNQLLVFDAAIDVSDWIAENGLVVLNVAGPRESKDHEIYQAVYHLLETVFYVSIISDAMPHAAGRSGKAGTGGGEGSRLYPVNVEEAVDTLVAALPARIKARIASMPGEEVSEAGANLARWICREFGLDSDNRQLLDRCREMAGRPQMAADGASFLIVRELSRRLQKIGHLRVVK